MSIERTPDIGSTEDDATHTDAESILSHHPAENDGSSDDTSTKLGATVQMKRNVDDMLRKIVMEKLGWMRSYIGVTHEALRSGSAEDVVQKIKIKINGSIPYNVDGGVDYVALQRLVNRNLGLLFSKPEA